MEHSPRGGEHGGPESESLIGECVCVYAASVT